ncbi:MAG: dTDP-4-amino-4,6-dideoxygalactose transaminase, partial [Candidatus Latescibacteria bacterium]|nr:dTDP-4-amino-4,6-dideoxygalactose transaminase [bacterium]MBD3423511.1 dTDP-4-amino-4,6-dideoxygalactose transaminase [Candidatus Latescibacterota bacterium]
VYKHGHISGNGVFTRKCQTFFEDEFGFRKTLLTTSCTDALEMTTLLLDIKPGDEVIMPSYTFVSTAVAFVRQGARIVFVDSRDDNPGMDEDSIEELISGKTRVIVPVHYAGIACDMDKIMGIADEHGLFVVEDAAQSIDSYYKRRPLGGIGNLGCFSFHETKNIQCGEGGMLSVNDERFVKRSEIVWEKGTNRAEFFRGEIDKYGWVDVGSSFLPSDIIASFLFAQLENLNDIQEKRKKIWEKYYRELKPISEEGNFGIPVIPEYSTCNGHMFYLVCNSLDERSRLIAFLAEKGIHAVFHYSSLHKSEYYRKEHDGRILKNADRFSDCLVRLPFYYELQDRDIEEIVGRISEFYK